MSNNHKDSLIKMCTVANSILEIIFVFKQEKSCLKRKYKQFDQLLNDS